ncbi:hypothetical protein F5X68DRAFT_234148 [Plectosphaerella plurivora]|uniref:NmrA-like domain-containing protein n=1 Tax=Plectosphaerella plurivora TaxID=936078 RepID=A0A9P9A9B9_9PEZI|nr:hypothetical protein F5X68DRAFT_234148 [Plectosphaerella plurivora]
MALSAASSKASNRSKFEDRGIEFRRIDYSERQSLVEGLRGVENLFFISSNSNNRPEEHGNLINAAKEAKVKHMWYTSLAYGGFTDTAKFAVQQDHLLTERLLKESGLTYTSVREGIYTESFCLFLDWYPSREKVLLPGDGEIAFALRSDLAEATANLMIRGGFENEIVLLTPESTITAQGMVDVINETTGRDVKLEFMSAKEFLEKTPQGDTRGKPAWWYKMTVECWNEISKGGLRTTHPLMAELLGREPTSPREGIRLLLEKNRDHQYF